MMKWAGLSILCLFLAVACGEEEVNREFGLCSDATMEEQQAMWDVYDAFCALGYEPTCCVVFVRDHDYPIGGTTWHSYRNPQGTDPRNPDEGYRGLYRPSSRRVYVRCFGEAEPYLVSLLIHELAHSVGFMHGEEMRQFERRVKEQMQK